MAAGTDKNGKKKRIKVVYRKHTQLDFTGGEIRGKIKTPAVFYIFQRKRTKAHHVITPVKNFDGHKKMTVAKLRNSLKK